MYLCKRFIKLAMHILNFRVCLNLVQAIFIVFQTPRTNFASVVLKKNIIDYQKNVLVQK